MLGLLLTAYLTQAAAAPTERPPRPSQEQLLAAVLDETPNARIVSSSFEPGRGCGLIEIGGTLEPFAVRTAWKEDRPGAPVVSSIAVRGEDGQMREHRVDPKPPHWEIIAVAPSRTDFDGDGMDWRERNMDVLARRTALLMCPALTAPEGTVWNVEPESDPDPVRGERNRQRAAAVTNMVFGDRTEPAPSTQP